MSLTNGTRLGPYEILSPLGAGGMGEVYKARDTRLGREVAVKVLPAEFAADRDRLRRFEQEARAAAALNHPNILVLHDLGTHEGAPYIVTELLEGESLRQRLRGGPLTPTKAVEFAIQIAQGLAAAHAKDIVHRDVKPENLFITRDGRVKILDFGLARLRAGDPLEEKGRSQAATADLPTREGTVLGTPGYMAPEQVRGLASDARSDLFAFGCVLYEMLSGERAFTGETPTDVTVAILTKELPPLAKDVQPSLERVVRRCLEKRPEDRFSSAQDLAFTLAAFGQDADDRAGTPRAGSPVRDDGPSIAVLPFANLSADPEQEYFCDGMAEEILNALAHVEALRVVARTSAFAFKGRTEDIRQIGRSLNVGAVLEGSVRKAGSQLRITAQLIDVATGYHLWSERYDRHAEDVFAIQDEISLAIVERLHVHLLGSERAAIERRHTENLDAHRAYLRGQFHWNTFTPEGFARSRQSFEEAVRIDPGYAPALAGLGQWYISQAFWADYPPEEAWSKASAFADQALRVAPDFWMGHTVKGSLLANFERRWTEAEAALRRAVSLGPGQAPARFNLAALQFVRRRWEEMATEVRLALRLDPLSPPYCAWNAIWLHAGGYQDEAASEVERLASVAPDHWIPHHARAMLAAGDGRLDEARASCERALELSGGALWDIALLACICQAAGDGRRTEELQAELEERARSGHVSPTFFAYIADARRDVSDAVRWLEHAFSIRDPNAVFYRGLPPTLRSGDPRIEAVLSKYGL
ncbi:MAG: protein kinase [Acidobacteriota bacterium]